MKGAHWNWIFLTIALGCDSTKSDADWDDSGQEVENTSDDGSADDDGGADDGLVLPAGLNGTPVDPAVPLISFSARNSDGAARSITDLVDGPTVIWFYPAAGTYG